MHEHLVKIPFVGGYMDGNILHTFARFPVGTLIDVDPHTSYRYDGCVLVLETDDRPPVDMAQVKRAIDAVAKVS